MVERGDLGGQHERCVGNVGFLWSGRCERRLPLGDDAPAQRTDESARQRRHSVDRGCCKLLQCGVHDLEESSLLQGTLRMRTDPLRASVTRDDRARARCSNERPAAPRTTVLSGLQDEASIVAVRKLSVDTHRTQLVGKHPAHHGDHAALRSEINKDVTRRPRLAPLEAHRLRLIRRRRNTHRTIVPSGRAHVPAWSTMRPRKCPTTSPERHPKQSLQGGLNRSSKAPSAPVTWCQQNRSRSSRERQAPPARRTV